MTTRPERGSPVPITAEVRDSHRDMRVNLLLAVAVTVLVWLGAVLFTIQQGFHPLVLYLFVGSVEALRNLALVPLHFLDHKNPALHSLVQYGKTMVIWLPHAIYVTYLGVVEVLAWDVDDFRFNRMMERAHRDAETMTEEEFMEGSIDER